MDVPFVIYADTESVLEEIDKCCSNLKKSSKTTINKHETWGYSLFKHCSFDITRNKHDYYSGQDGNKPCNSNNQLRKKIIPLTNVGANRTWTKKAWKLVIKTKMNLLMMTMEFHSVNNIIKYQVIIITLVQIRALLIMFVT